MKNKLIIPVQHLKNSVKEKLEKKIVPGFAGMNAWEVLKFFWVGFTNISTNMRASGISFRIFLAFFPSIITLFSLIPFIPIDHFQEDVFQVLKNILPGQTFNYLETALYDLLNKKQTTLLSIGFLLMIYYASASLNAIMQAFHASQHIEDSPHPLIIRVVSVILMFVLGFLFILSLAFQSIGEDTIHQFYEKGYISTDFNSYSIQIFQWGFSLMLIYTIITLLYNAGFSVRWRKKWKFWNTGSIFTTATFVLSSFGFSYFLEHFAQYDKLYGSLGTLMVILIWMNVNMIILLVGFDLNVLIRKTNIRNQLTRQQL
jgi:membrane protein